MPSSGLTSVVLILFIFSLIHLFITLSIDIAHIKNNWDKYKCNPGIIPFAGFFDRDPIETSKECTKSTQMNFMSAFLKPIYKSIEFLSTNGNFFSNIFSDIKLFGNDNLDFEVDIFRSIDTWSNQMSTNISTTLESFTSVFQNVNSLFTSLSLGLTQASHIISASLQEIPFFIVRDLLKA